MKHEGEPRRGGPLSVCSERLSFSAEQLSFSAERLSFSAERLSFSAERLSFSAERLSFSAERLSFSAERLPVFPRFISPGCSVNAGALMRQRDHHLTFPPLFCYYIVYNTLL
jgi:hypothetical protein